MQEDEILTLYNQGRPIRELARQFHLQRPIIRNILKKHGLPLYDSRTALIRMGHIKEKQKVILQSEEKAYLYGLVGGDLTPVKKSGYTLKLITNTTHPHFAKLLLTTFYKYGTTNYKLNKDNAFRFQTHLDLESFSFLLESKTKISKEMNDKDLFYFLAGFIDSDGGFVIKKVREHVQYGIRFFGENLSILLEVKQRLERQNYKPILCKTHSKGEVHFYKNKKFRYNEDYYTLELSRKREVFELLERLPIRHPEKIAKRKLIQSIETRNIKHWKDVENEIITLRKTIQESVKTGLCLPLTHLSEQLP